MLWDIWYTFKNFGIAWWVFLRDLSRPLRENFSFRHVLCLQGMLKLVFLYCACLCWIIVINFELPDKFGSKDTTIAIYTTERIGEKLHADRMKIAAKANGWQVISACFEESMINFPLTKHFYVAVSSLVNFIYQPKFNIAVTHYVNIVPYGYNITYLNMPNESLFDIDGHFRYSNLAHYDAYVDLYTIAHESNPMLLKELARLGKSDAPVIPLYLAQNYIDYSPANRDEVLLIGSLWGCGRNSLYTKLALKKLADEKMLVAYGPKDSLSFLGDDAYKGNLESAANSNGMNGDIPEALVRIFKEHGISLAIHNLGHNVDMLPTSRLVESIAAGAIVISDQNGFAQKFFGDNVLYIDLIAKEEEIYSQIKRHVEWIRSHPEEAEAKAKAAYDIFVREFTLEDALKKLMNLRKS